MTAAAPPNHAEGLLRARFASIGGRTRVLDLREAGGYRMRFPKVPAGPSSAYEAVCINTGGGMVGGDRLGLDFACGPGAALTLTTQSAEKMYGSAGATTQVSTALDVEAGGRLDWLPQETILFDRARFARTLDVRLAPDATFLALEALVFGRLAMGETMRTGLVRDRWRVQRGGRLVFAEDLRLEGPVEALLDRPALGGGARAFATLLLVASDAEARLEPLRAALAPLGEGVDWGASAWNGLLSWRAAAVSPERLRRSIVAALDHLRGQPAPRVWQ
ncbi:urease accessory protein UreD [Lichenihabitans sp. Uapishka_5]|uniref:urease accessory protein UreD n=1 Tax=Lichenihabitans sp. Uapishka_5 TaxID=3037302 RepID=UPI0029E7D59C|nr:urease accessory protein UreD [Lichenihabitans sp. Uapishka_5]MDX7951708.1 urease accessory protein UreD [Lichenihabitans sp. Uapishka_5]